MQGAEVGVHAAQVVVLGRQEGQPKRAADVPAPRPWCRYRRDRRRSSALRYSWKTRSGQRSGDRKGRRRADVDTTSAVPARPTAAPAQKTSKFGGRRGNVAVPLPAATALRQRLQLAYCRSGNLGYIGKRLLSGRAPVDETPAATTGKDLPGRRRVESAHATTAERAEGQAALPARALKFDHVFSGKANALATVAIAEKQLVADMWPHR